MNYAILVSGGVGSRMKNASLPKQYLTVNGKPIILYTLEKFFTCKEIDVIVIVAAESWQPIISGWLSELGWNKPYFFANAGASRQESVYNGLKTCISRGCNSSDKALVHDVVRPCVSMELIKKCLVYSEEYDGVLPVLPVTDTMYVSSSGGEITGLLERNTLFGGQSPECFNLQKYYSVHRGLTTEQLAQVHGSSEIAFANGMKIKLIPGEALNFKITTVEDLSRFELMVNGGER